MVMIRVTDDDLSGLSVQEFHLRPILPREYPDRGLLLGSSSTQNSK